MYKFVLFLKDFLLAETVMIDRKLGRERGETCIKGPRVRLKPRPTAFRPHSLAHPRSYIKKQVLCFRLFFSSTFGFVYRGKSLYVHLKCTSLAVAGVWIVNQSEESWIKRRWKEENSCPKAQYNINKDYFFSC